MKPIDKQKIASTSRAGAVVPAKGVAAPVVEDVSPPVGRGFRTIPSSIVLEAIIERAVAALKRGIYWDRGSIINIVV